MATKKIGNLAVKTGEFTPQGADKPKGTYENVGTLMQNDDGSQFLLIKKCINFAGFDNSDSNEVLVSVFNNNNGSNNQQNQN
jgi:hypothetical protein